MTPDPGIGLHRRQYVVGPRPRPEPGWTVLDLDRGLSLSHCPDLRVARRRDRDGVAWVLLGLACQTRPDRPDPTEAIAASTTADMGRTAESWAGRWALIGNGELHLDATGQLACHWTVDADDGPWATSSPALLRTILGAGEGARSPQPVYERGLSWVAPPAGHVHGARRLLPSQILDLVAGETRRRRLIVPPAELDDGGQPAAPDRAPVDGTRAMVGFVEALGHAMARLPTGEPRWLGLTAGADSRLVLASAIAAGVPVQPYTRRAARMSVADRTIPPRLAAAVDLEHRWLTPGRTKPDRLRLARAHTDGVVSDGDALPFVQGVRDGFSGIEIGGQGLGAGKMKLRDLPAKIDDPTALANRLADHLGEPARSANRPALARWLAMVAARHQSEPPAERVDWRDRFYLEQRTAGWQAAKEQLYDLHRHHRFFPINSARTIGWLLAIDPGLRSTGEHRRRLIELAEPRLMAEPFNPPGRSFPIRTQVSHAVAIDRRGLVVRVGRRLVGRRTT